MVYVILKGVLVTFELTDNINKLQQGSRSLGNTNAVHPICEFPDIDTVVSSNLLAFPGLPQFML